MSPLTDTPAWLQLVFWTSCHASLLALLLLAFQPSLARRISPRWRFALWMLVILRFAPLPLPQCPYSVLQLLPERSTPAVVQNPIQPLGIHQESAGMPPALQLEPVRQTEVTTGVSGRAPVETADATPSVTLHEPVAMASETPAPPTVAAAASFAWPQWITAIYLAGTALVAIRFALVMLSLRRIVRRATPIDDPAILAALASARSAFHIHTPIAPCYSDDMSSPALVGMLRPRLLLPRDIADSLTPDELSHVLLHECAHHARRDVLANYILTAAAILHWFNPLIWLILPRIRAERELATDELVLRHADRTAYGHTLLKLFDVMRPRTLRHAPAAVAIIENPKNSGSFFSRRIHMIAAAKKRSSWLAIPAVLALAALAAGTLPPSRGQSIPVNPEPAAAPRSSVSPTSATLIPTPPVGIPAAAASTLSTTSVPQVAPRQTVPPAQRPGRGRNSAQVTALPPVDASGAPTGPIGLQEFIRSIDAENMALEKVLAYLRVESHTNIVVNWNALAIVGVTRDTPVSVSLRDVAFRKVLATVLDLAAGQSGKLTFKSEDGVITISSTQDFIDAPTPLVAPAPLVFRETASHSPAINGAPSPIAVLQGTMESMMSKAVDLAAMAANNKLALAEQKLAAYEGQMKQENPQYRSMPEYVDNDSIMRDLMTSLLTQEQELAVVQQTTPSPSIPRVRELNARIESIQQQIEARRKVLTSQYAQRTDERAANKAEMVTRIYDVREIINVPITSTAALNADQRAALEELSGVISSIIASQGTVSVFNGALVIRSTEEIQTAVVSILDELKKHEVERADRAKAAYHQSPLK